MTVNLPVGSEKESFVKVTIMLPKDTVTKLDAMADKALMGSRGRVIQSIVDSLWDSKYDLEQIQTFVNAFQSIGPQAQSKTENLASLFLMLMFPLGNVIRRINQYIGISVGPPIGQNPPTTTNTAHWQS